MFKKHFLTVMLIAALFTATTVYSQTTNTWLDFYDQAPVIQIIDPMAMLVGSLPEGKNMLTIKLTDVALYSGHVCVGIASGYILTKMALDSLYLDSIPERGQIRVAAMAPSDLFDVASYITGARAFYGRDEINANDLAIDPWLTPKKQGKLAMVFQRKDTGKAVTAVFNKFKLIPPDQAKGIKAFLKKMLAGKVLPQEKEKKWGEIQALVKKVLLETPEGVLEITSIDNYQFPKTAN